MAMSRAIVDPSLPKAVMAMARAIDIGTSFIVGAEIKDGREVFTRERNAFFIRIGYQVPPGREGIARLRQIALVDASDAALKAEQRTYMVAVVAVLVSVFVFAVRTVLVAARHVGLVGLAGDDQRIICIGVRHNVVKYSRWITDGDLLSRRYITRFFNQVATRWAAII